jgi:acetylornithine deacetylase
MDELTQLLSDLVAIDSTNPDLVSGGAGEGEIARFVARWMRNQGLEVETVEASPGRSDVVGIARGRRSRAAGSGGGKTLVLNGHMDTVGAGNMPDPHAPRIEAGRLYGRGAYDMKGGLAACMFAAAQAAKQHLRGDVIVQAVVDEEYASVGTQAVAPRYQADGAIVAEFTELRLILAHKGFVWLEVETLGKAAHGSRPDLGVDAIAKMGRVLTGVEELDERLRGHPTHALLGSGSVHASLIQGGRELSSYPDRCVLSIERRTLPGETPQGAEAEIAAILDSLRNTDSSFNAVLRRGLDRPPLETPADSLIAMTVQSAAMKTVGHAAPIAGVPFWTDAALLHDSGVPAVLFGPAGTGAHSDEEWVDLASVEACAKTYLQTAIEFCA